MKSHYQGIDFLRGLGVFSVVILHTGFYFFGGLYDLDLDNPSLVVTLIGFLLMFAGLFAMISGFSHTLAFMKYHQSEKSRVRYMVLQGLLTLGIAYAYFLFTGPGIVQFESRSMDESLLVSLINQGNFQSLTLERIFYVDSLVMLAMNVLLLSLLFRFISKQLTHPKMPHYMLLSAVLFMALSYIRIPLYTVYLEARDEGNWILIFLLNWFVAKNNPILPFFAFALFGVWMALLIKTHEIKYVRGWLTKVGLFFVLQGIIGYILAPETMLERAIDPTWYFIMVTQIGLFMIFILITLSVFDFRNFKGNPVTRFISRFGVAGLSVFFIESVVSALIFRIISQIVPLSLDIPGAILYGFILALTWGFVLMAWEKKHYKFSMEYIMGVTLSKFGTSSKLEKLKGHVS